MCTPENRNGMHEIGVDKLKDVVGGSNGNGSNGGPKDYEDYCYCRYCRMNTMVRFSAQGDPICSVCRRPFNG